MKDLNHIKRFNELELSLIERNNKDINESVENKRTDFNISDDYSDSEKINNLIQIIEDLYINWNIKTIDVYMNKHKDEIINIIKSK